MATSFNLNAKSKFCRDCGGPTTVFPGAVICENTTTKGTQKEPKDVCEPLSRNRRNFCEHCGERVDRIPVCCHCGKAGFNP